MRIAELHLQDFRNIPFASLKYDGIFHFLLGANAQGKTNLLEALSLMTALRSFRTQDNRELIRFSEKEARLRYVIEHEREGKVEITASLKPGAKELLVDGERVTRLGDFIGRFPTVACSSRDIQLLRGAPQLRRRFTDLIISAVDSEYLASLRRYYRALQGRNRLLKQRASAAELVSFEKPLVTAAIQVMEKRREFFLQINDELKPLYQLICQTTEEAELGYKPDVKSSTEDEYVQLLKETSARDHALQTTTKGPHRDDFSIMLDGRDASSFASEGQQRGLVIALRLAQAAWFRARSGVLPVVLADDILGELDPQRRAGFWKGLDPAIQVFASGTELPVAESTRSWEVWQVKEGVFSQDSNDG